MDEIERTIPLAKDWLKQKLRTRAVHAGVMGLGQHGLLVAVAIANAGFAVTGIDVDGQRVATINTGRVADTAVVDSVLSTLVDTRRLRATQSLMALEHLDVVTICVPTSYPSRAQTDLSCLIAAMEAIRIHLHQGLLIVIDSTMPPGIPTQVLLPILQRSGLQIGVDFFLAHRLRHVVPGPWLGPTGTAGASVMGITTHCHELAALYYHYLITSAKPVA